MRYGAGGCKELTVLVDRIRRKKIFRTRDGSAFRSLYELPRGLR